MIKIDLHTHSIISPDGAGSTKKSDFERFLKEHILDCIAITDHNETRFALAMRKQFGERIIVGEEITTRDGEMIGLFLQRTIAPFLTAEQTIEEIHKQNGLVYIPHPFETVRRGIQREILEKIVADIDILEVFNGRARFRGKAQEAEAFARKHALLSAASSDAHGAGGFGRTFTFLLEVPTRKTLKPLLRQGKLQKEYAPLWTYLYPIRNLVKNKSVLSYVSSRMK